MAIVLPRELERTSTGPSPGSVISWLTSTAPAITPSFRSNVGPAMRGRATTDVRRPPRSRAMGVRAERAVDELVGGPEVGGGIEHALGLFGGEVLARDFAERA